MLVGKLNRYTRLRTQELRYLIYLLIKCPILVRPVAGHTDCHGTSVPAPFTLSYPADVAKFFSKPRCSALPVKPQQVWPVCSAAGSMLSEFFRR